MTHATAPIPRQANSSYLSDAEIGEFQKLVQESTGICLDHETAARRASQLIYLLGAVLDRTAESPTWESSNIVSLDELVRSILD